MAYDLSASQGRPITRGDHGPDRTLIVLVHGLRLSNSSGVR